MLKTLSLLAKKLDDIHNVGVDTKDTCYRVEKGLQMGVRTPRPTFLDVASDGSQSGVTRSAKRPRTEIGSASDDNRGNLVQNNRPKPKVGTSGDVIGHSMPAIVAPPLMQGGQTRPKFDRSLWVSRFHIETTTDQILDYVMSKTGCDDRSKFYCKKLVKRDADLTTLRFISFKIDVLEEFFDGLSDPSIWPNYVLVREFISERTNNAVQVARFVEPMDTMDVTAQSNSSIGTSGE